MIIHHRHGKEIQRMITNNNNQWQPTPTPTPTPPKRLFGIVLCLSILSWFILGHVAIIYPIIYNNNNNNNDNLQHQQPSSSSVSIPPFHSIQKDTKMEDSTTTTNIPNIPNTPNNLQSSDLHLCRVPMQMELEW